MYDVVFISYKEPNAEENWNNLKAKCSSAKRIHGVTGIHRAHITAAKIASTDMFFVVDGDAQIVDDFSFDYLVDPAMLNAVHVWRSINPINGLVYGYGGIKLLPRELSLKMDVNKPDMTTSISNHFKPVMTVSNVTAFNTDPFNAWKSGFRECAKLSSKIIDRQKDDETNKRLDIWCSVGGNKLFGNYAIKGALAGREYGEKFKDKIKQINDFNWLYETFLKENNVNNS